MITKNEKEKMILKYEKHIKAKSGIFTSKTRARLLGTKIKGREPSEFKGSQQEANFWYRQKIGIKSGLRDLELFMEGVDEKKVNEIITFENINPLVELLLLRPTRKNSIVNLDRVKIARIFIQRGFQYLRKMSKDSIGGLHERAISEALEVCDYLVDLHLPASERLWKRPS